MIEAQNLTKRYGQRLAVDNVSFKIKTGKVTGFLGPNGAGKSTTLRLMLGLDMGAGLTLFDGKLLQEHPQPSRVVGILLEAKAFHPTRTAREHLRVLAAAGDVPLARVDEVLDMVGLTAVAKNRPGKFSLGMSQRLGIAAAILGDPKYLLLDEPANGLDPEGIAWLRDFLRHYASRGKGVFVSSHLLSEMSQLADNIVVIGKGKLIADTSVEALLSDKGHSGTFVRTSKTSAFKKVLKQAGYEVTESNGGLIVAGVKPEVIGKLAYEAGVPVGELSPHGASLEEAFLELTATSGEYHGKTGGKKS